MSFILFACIAFITSFVSLLIFRQFAIRFQWLDSPNVRKHHSGEVPLVGGVSTLCGVLAATLLYPSILAQQSPYMLSSCLLVFIGFVDDKYDLSAKSRLAMLVILAAWLVLSEGVAISYLGDLLGNGVFSMSYAVAALFSVAAIISSITAFNMVDGIDGLLGALASVTLLSLSVIFYKADSAQYSVFCVVFVSAMLPYILFNLFAKEKYKVFMGDAGSILVGFTVIWLLVIATQPNSIEQPSSVSMAPVNALWVMAVPIMDMVLVMLKRISRKQSPLKADRSHIHHLLLASGCSPKVTLICLISFSALLAGIGVWLNVTQVDESVSLLLFFSVFAGYCLFTFVLKMKVVNKLGVAF